MRRGDAQRAARALQFRQAPDDHADGRAVRMGQSGHVKDYARLPCRDHGIHFFLQTHAIRPIVNAALYFNGDHPWLQNSFFEMQDHDGAPFSSSYGNSRIMRTQSPSAEKNELTQPHGRNGAAFWFTGLSASA